jgi:hypothetical protein
VSVTHKEIGADYVAAETAKSVTATPFLPYIVIYESPLLIYTLLSVHGLKSCGYLFPKKV